MGDGGDANDEGAEEDEDGKFSKMQEESDNIIMNIVKMTKRGSHDDVFILEK